MGGEPVTSNDVLYTMNIEGLPELETASCLHLVARDAGNAYWVQSLSAPMDSFAPRALAVVSQVSSYPLDFFVINGDERLCGLIEGELRGKPLPPELRENYCISKVSDVLTVPSFKSLEGLKLEAEQIC